MDSARTAMRLGADRVRIVYRRSREEMPARAAEIHHAEEEGIEFHLLTAPTRFIGDEKGRVKAMECLRMELGEPDASGRRSPVPVKDSKFRLECDLAVIAVGAGANPLLTRSTPELNLPSGGTSSQNPKQERPASPGSGAEVISSPVRQPSSSPWVRAGRHRTPSTSTSPGGGKGRIGEPETDGSLDVTG